MNFPELTRKAEAGSCAAQTTLGLYYLHGYGPVEVDYEKAFDLLSKATEKGASRAVANLADMYAQGLGVAQDIPKAIELYERVGTIEFFAALELGRIYAKGLGVPANPRKAFEWYSAVVALNESTSITRVSVRSLMRRKNISVVFNPTSRRARIANHSRRIVITDCAPSTADI